MLRGHGLPVAVGMNAYCLAWVPAWNEEARANRISLLTPSGEAYYFNHDVERLRWFEQLDAEAEGAADVGEGIGFSGALSFFVYLGALTPVCTSPCPL